MKPPLPTAPEPASTPGRRLLPWAALALAAGAAFAGIALTLSHSEPQRPSEPPLAVAGERVDIKQGAPTWGYIELTQASLGAPIAPAPVPGRVAVDETRATSVVAPLPGHVDTVAVRLGQRVRQGEHLLAVRSAALVDLFREIETLQAKEAARSKGVERLRALVQLKAAPEKDLVAAEQELRLAQLAREATETKMRSLSVAAANEGLYWITAPRHGVVVERTVLTGQEVGPERGEPLMVVAELDEVIVTADVPESDVVGLQAGQPATISSPASPEHELTGTVEHVGEAVDPVRRMVDVRIRVPNSEHTLRPNAFVQVSFTPDGQQHVLTPAEAVVTDDQRAFIFVQSPDRPTSLERRPVVTGRQHEGKVEILKGLEPGQTYVSKGAILLLNAIDLAE